MFLIDPILLRRTRPPVSGAVRTRGTTLAPCASPSSRSSSTMSRATAMCRSSYFWRPTLGDSSCVRATLRTTTSSPDAVPPATGCGVTPAISSSWWNRSRRLRLPIGRSGTLALVRRRPRREASLPARLPKEVLGGEAGGFVVAFVTQDRRGRRRVVVVAHPFDRKVSGIRRITRTPEATVRPATTPIAGAIPNWSASTPAKSAPTA